MLALTFTIFSILSLTATIPVSASTAPATLAKEWRGSFLYTSGFSGKMTVKDFAVSSKGVVSGSIRYSTGGGGKISGSLKGHSVHFKNLCLASLGCGEGTPTNELIKFSGTLAGTTKMSGTFKNVTENSGGTWKLGLAGG